MFCVKSYLFDLVCLDCYINYVIVEQRVCTDLRNYIYVHTEWGF